MEGWEENRQTLGCQDFPPGQHMWAVGCALTPILSLWHLQGTSTLESQSPCGFRRVEMPPNRNIQVTGGGRENSCFHPDS